jgi:hypothetical protein
VLLCFRGPYVFDTFSHHEQKAFLLDSPCRRHGRAGDRRSKPPPRRSASIVFASTPPKAFFGVDFNEAEEQMALNSVNRNLDSYEQLRKLNIPLDTEPAITFRPYLPGRKPTERRRPERS